MNLNSEYNLLLSLLMSQKSPDETLLCLNNWKFRGDEQGRVKIVEWEPLGIEIKDILIEI